MTAHSHRPVATSTHVLDVVFVCISLVCLSLPLAALLVGGDTGESDLRENRTLAKRPVLGAGDIWTLPWQWTDYFRDHFAFRRQLIRLHGLVRLRGFGISPSTRVVVGRDGWLFYTGGRMLNDHRGRIVMDNMSLQRWATALEAHRRWLAQRNTGYLFVVVPEKLTIYPDRLPRGCDVPEGPTTTEQLVRYLAENSGVSVLDLRPIMAEVARTDGLVYYPQGTHWTRWGAYRAYRELCKAMQSSVPDLSPLEPDALVAYDDAWETLCRMMGVADDDWVRHRGTEWRPAMKAREATPPSLSPGARSELGTGEAFENPDAPDRRLIVMHDSFFQGFVMEALALQFRRSVWYRATGTVDGRWLAEVVEHEQPDLVIEEHVERFLKWAPTLADVGTQAAAHP